MKRLLAISVLRVAAGLAAIYAGDYLLLRFQLPNHRAQYSSVMVSRSWAIPQKDRKTEYTFDPPAPETCVNSLFPHFGYSPCWYLRRHTRQQVNVGG